MTPKEKAVDIFYKYYQATKDHNIAKECTLIAIDEIINSGPLEPNDAEEWLQPADWFSEANISAEKYWIEVKKQIEAL
jgi:hypothetical protein